MCFLSLILSHNDKQNNLDLRYSIRIFIVIFRFGIDKLQNKIDFKPFRTKHKLYRIEFGYSYVIINRSNIESESCINLSHDKFM